MAGWTSSSPSNPGSYGFRNATASSTPSQAPQPASSAQTQSKQIGSGRSTPMGASSSPAGGGADMSALIAALQNQNKGPVAAPAPLVNTSTTNKTIDQTVLPALLSRAQGGMGADTAIRLAQGSTRDMLSGTLKELEGGASRRGVGGSGAEGLQKRAATTKAQQAMAGQSSQIAYGAEQDRNKLYEDIAGIAGNSDQLQNEQRRIGLSQWQAQQNVNLDQQRINQAKDDRLLSILTQALF